MPCITIWRTRAYEELIYDAIEGARLSYGSGGRMDSTLDDQGRLTIGPEDRKFCEARLGAGVSGEDKFGRTIHASCFITAPLRWFFDFDTYKVATVKQSSSLMHYFKSRGELTAANFTPTTDSRLIDIANEKYRAWIAAGGKTNFTSREWEEFQDAIGRGYLYTAHWKADYAVLRNIHRQRRYHRQGEWRVFCDWIESLLHSWLITFVKQKARAEIA